MKITLDIESTEFKIHALRKERVVGTYHGVRTHDTSIFMDEDNSDEIIKIYVSFYSQKNRAQPVEYIKKLRKKVRAGMSKLNLLNPFFLGINYGKISVNSEEYTQVSLDKCDLIFREGIYLKSTYLLCSIYKFTNYITNDLSIKILAFDNQNGVEYMIDLEYNDLLEMTDSNVDLLNHSKDLSAFLTSGLTFFKNSEDENILV